MFGLFKNKKFDYECPVCEFQYNVKFNPYEITEWNDSTAPDTTKCKTLSELACDFCKTALAITYFKRGEVEAIDIKWKVIEDKYEKESHTLGYKIGEIEYALEENPEDKKLEKELTKLQKKEERLDEAFDNKENRYDERKEKWFEKLQDKLEK